MMIPNDTPDNTLYQQLKQLRSAVKSEFQWRGKVSGFASEEQLYQWRNLIYSKELTEALDATDYLDLDDDTYSPHQA